MNEPVHPEWSELGVTWRAIVLDANATRPMLLARLRRQSRWIRGGLAATLLLGSIGLILGAATLWSGFRTDVWHFVIRGAAIIVLSVMFAVAAWGFARVRSTDLSCTLSQMLDLAIQRSLRIGLLTRLGMLSCSVAAGFGLIGTAIRSRLGEPPRLLPVIDLVILLLFAAVLFLCGRQAKASAARYSSLKQTLVGEGPD